MGDDNGEGQPQQHDGDQRDYAREDQGRDYAREDQGRDRSRSRSRDREPGPGKERGIALRWNQEKGFGFIKPDSGGDDLFCHFSCVEGGNMLKEGSEVPPPAPAALISPLPAPVHNANVGGTPVQCFYAKIFDERKGKDRAEQVSGPAVCNEDRDARFGGGFGGGGGAVSTEGKDRGVACRWNGEKGFGFIKPEDGGEDLFCHVS